MANSRLEIKGYRDLAGAEGDGVRGATEPSVKRRSLSGVPDAQRLKWNIKKLPLISHKAAANRTDALKVLAPFCSRTNERRRRSPSTSNVRQSLGHGRSILCLYAYCYSSGIGECADWYHHHARNQEAQIRPSRASLAASLFAGQYGLLVALCRLWAASLCDLHAIAGATLAPTD